jgi:hypothetical protein
MDKIINKKIKTYVTDFKAFIKTKTLETFSNGSVASSITGTAGSELEQKVNDFLQEMYNYETLVLSKDDVCKKKRIKNAIPGCNRCIAKRATGEQCTRKQKEGYEYCGTHVKGVPHGIVTTNDEIQQENELVRSEVVAKDIHGIVYYIDTYNNVYKTEDILNQVKNPTIIAKCEIINGEYGIRKFGLV